MRQFQSSWLFRFLSSNDRTDFPRVPEVPVGPGVSELDHTFLPYHKEASQILNHLIFLIKQNHEANILHL